MLHAMKETQFISSFFVVDLTYFTRQTKPPRLTDVIADKKSLWFIQQIVEAINAFGGKASGSDITDWMAEHHKDLCYGDRKILSYRYLIFWRSSETKGKCGFVHKETRGYFHKEKGFC